MPKDIQLARRIRGERGSGGGGGGVADPPDVRRGRRAAAPQLFSIDYHGLRIRAVPVGSVFLYHSTALGGYRLAKQPRGALAALYDKVVAGEGGLCDVSTGVSVSQSLKPSSEGNGLLYQAGCKLLVAMQGNVLEVVAIICTYEVGEELIEPCAFGVPTDNFVRSQPGASVLMLELICAQGEATADSRNSNYLAAKGLVEAMNQYATQQGYSFVVAKAENARSRDFLRRRGFTILFQRGAQAAMQAATGSITV